MSTRRLVEILIWVDFKRQLLLHQDIAILSMSCKVQIGWSKYLQSQKLGKFSFFTPNLVENEKENMDFWIEA
jgi:hypothetical protein